MRQQKSSHYLSLILPHDLHLKTVPPGLGLCQACLKTPSWASLESFVIFEQSFSGTSFNYAQLLLRRSVVLWSRLWHNCHFVRLSSSTTRSTYQVNHAPVAFLLAKALALAAPDRSFCRPQRWSMHGRRKAEAR